MEMAEHGDVGSGLTLTPLQEKALEAVLVQLAAKSSAALALLSSRTGHYISSRGTRHDVDTAALASLGAAALAATPQLPGLGGAAEAATPGGHGPGGRVRRPGGESPRRSVDRRRCTSTTPAARSPSRSCTMA